MAIYNAKKLTITKGEDTYIIDPLQGNESVYVDLVANIAKNAWTQGQSYTYRFTDSHITANAGIMVGFKENIREGLVGDLKYTKGTGYVDFETNEMPIGPISVLVRVIDSATNGVYPIDAAIVETDAIIGETTVQGALEDLDERATSIAQNMAKHASLADEYDDTATYAVGDLCIYENSLYKCSSAIETAEDWTASHWTVTTLDAELAARDTSISTNATNIGKLKSDIGIVEDGDTCTHSGGIAKGQYVIWKGDLYTADAAISVGETFYSSGGSKNLSAKTEGAANDLNSNLTTLRNDIAGQINKMVFINFYTSSGKTIYISSETDKIVLQFFAYRDSPSQALSVFAVKRRASEASVYALSTGAVLPTATVENNRIKMVFSDNYITGYILASYPVTVSLT